MEPRATTHTMETPRPSVLGSFLRPLFRGVSDHASLSLGVVCGLSVRAGLRQSCARLPKLQDPSEPKGCNGFAQRPKGGRRIGA